MGEADEVGVFKVGSDQPAALAGLPAASARTVCWANHGPIMKASGLEVVGFRYLDRATQTLDFDGMLADLDQASPGDAGLLQACCHNPSGVDRSLASWQAVIAVVQRRRLLPIPGVARHRARPDRTLGFHAMIVAAALTSGRITLSSAVRHDGLVTFVGGVAECLVETWL